MKPVPQMDELPVPKPPNNWEELTLPQGELQDEPYPLIPATFPRVIKNYK
jgi:hypothetical protein